MTELWFADEHFVPRNDRTLWHPQSESLFLADLHLGKSDLFRKSGIPIPGELERSDLERLHNAVQCTDAKTVWILGDLFHQPKSVTTKMMSDWCRFFNALGVKLELILGNHDRSAETLAMQLGFQLNPEPTAWGAIDLAHHPDSNPKRSRIAGHIHPQVIFQQRTDRLVFPCFAILRSKTLLLPAFTAFSGGPRFTPRDAQCYAITPDGVLSPPNLPQPMSENEGKK